MLRIELLQLPGPRHESFELPVHEFEVGLRANEVRVYGSLGIRYYVIPTFDPAEPSGRF